MADVWETNLTEERWESQDTPGVTWTVIVGSPGSGPAPAGDHNDLAGRDAEKAHPISAIDGLEEALEAVGPGASAFAALVDVSFADAVDGQHAAIHDGVIVPSGPPWTVTERGPLHLETVATITAPWGWVTEGEGDVWEPDTAKFDPVTGLWVLMATGGDADDVSMVGGVVSADGEEWEPISPGEPLFGPAEDPNLVRALDGTVWRDADGRAWCLCEEMGEGGAHRGIELWRSGPNLLTGWTSAGRVIDRGGEGEWDEQDRTSPTGQHDGDGSIVVLFEGRDNPTVTATGGIGRAVLDEDGVLVSVDAVPLISPGVPESWYAPDDIVRVGDAWAVLAHGTGDGQPDGMRRFITADPISEWTAESFVECSAELTVDGVSWSEAVAVFGVDPTLVTVTLFDPLRVVSARVVSGDPTVDVAALEEATATAQQTANDAAGAASAAAGTAGSALSAAGAAQSAVTAETAARVAADGELAALVSRFAHPEHASGSFIDLTSFGLPGYTALDGASDLDLAGGATLVPESPSTGNAGAALPHTMPPDPVVPPVEGAVLAGVILRGVTVTGGLANGVSLALSVAAMGPPPPMVAWVSAGGESADWTRGSAGEPILAGPHAAAQTADVVIVADGAWFGVSINLFAAGTGLDMPASVEVAGIDWLWQVPAGVAVGGAIPAPGEWMIVPRKGHRTPGPTSWSAWTSTASAEDRFEFHAFDLHEGIDFDRLRVRVTGANDGDGAVARIGFMTTTPDGRPGEVIFQTTVPVGVAEAKELTVSGTLPAGRLMQFVGFQGLNTSGSNPSLSAADLGAQQAFSDGPFSSTPPSWDYPHVQRLTATGITGDMPDSPTVSFQANNTLVPITMIRRAAA